MVGLVGFGTWQVAVESAQVMAGLVEYPRSNPFYMYHSKLWTISHQAAAALLYVGLSESTVSLLFSGLLGMLSFQALALAVLAVSRDAWLSLAFPFFVEYTRLADMGIAYPIWLMGTTHTYGSLGLSFALLALVLLANARWRAGAFALGLAPAVHPSIAAWLWLLVVLAVAWEPRVLARARHAARWLFAGALLTAASLLFHLAVTYDVPRADPEASARYMEAFVTLWDTHRKPMPLNLPSVYLAGVAALVAALFLSKRAVPPELRFYFRVLVLAGVVGTLGLLVSWVPPERLPKLLLTLMPGRVINLGILASMPLLFGLLAGLPHLASRLVLAVLVLFGVYLPTQVGVAFAGPNSNLHPAVHGVLWPPSWPFLGFLAGFATVVTGMFLSHPTLPLSAEDRAAASPPRRQKRRKIEPPRAAQERRLTLDIVRVVTLGLLAWTAAITLIRVRNNWELRHDVLRGRQNDALLRRVGEDRGMLLTASDLHLIQLRTRRPVLMDGGGIDLIMYTVEAAPAVDRILKRIYGIDLFAPPPEVEDGAIPAPVSQALWERRAPDEWRAIAEEFDVTGVLAYPQWRLQLPLVGSSDELAYYRIPR